MSNNGPNPKSPTEAGDNEDFPTLKIRTTFSMPGLEAHPGFSFSTMDEIGVLRISWSMTDPNARLSAMPPITFSDGCSPIIPSFVWLCVGLAEGADPLTLVIVHPVTGSYPHTTDLLASLVIDPDTMSALQIVLEDRDWPSQVLTGDLK